MSRRRTRGRVQRGSAVPWVVVMMALLLTVTVASAALGGALVARRRAEAAADLAALAAAAALQRAADPCSAAAAAARLNQADLTGCTVSGQDVTVVATCRVRSLFGRELTLRGRARAGPS